MHSSLRKLYSEKVEISNNLSEYCQLTPIPQRKYYWFSDNVYNSYWFATALYGTTDIRIHLIKKIKRNQISSSRDDRTPAFRNF